MIMTAPQTPTRCPGSVVGCRAPLLNPIDASPARCYLAVAEGGATIDRGGRHVAVFDPGGNSVGLVRAG